LSGVPRPLTMTSPSTPSPLGEMPGDNELPGVLRLPAGAADMRPRGRVVAVFRPLAAGSSRTRSSAGAATIRSRGRLVAVRRPPVVQYDLAAGVLKDSGSIGPGHRLRAWQHRAWPPPPPWPCCCHHQGHHHRPPPSCSDSASTREPRGPLPARSCTFPED
jgi:hypothetical protein